MVSPLCLLLALVLLYHRPASSLDCDLPPRHGGPETFILVNQMGRLSLLSCLEFRKDFQFPQTLVDGSRLEKTQARVVVQEMLQEVFSLFSTNDSFEAWEETVLDKFLIELYQQLEDLEKCLEKEWKVGLSALGSEDTTLAVKRYFQGIRLYLKEKEYSSCAWEIVRVEIRRCLFSINKLIRKPRK
ncbi:interferon alpha-6-like [Talpa occidentalis]|uniref:interferon alpha-6-like n=1 Tax=Talpa occidentalis TaxID=50954 RepID=UPI00188F04A2|nr:interferon alpha-6-like [Talpa occidentalis]